MKNNSVFHNEKTPPLIPDKRRALIINILTDAVIFDKIGNSISELSGGYFGLDNKYSGYTSAVVLLGIPDPVNSNDPLHLLHERLGDIFLNYVNLNGKKEPEEVAKQILKEWEIYLEKSPLKINL